MSREIFWIETKRGNFSRSVESFPPVTSGGLAEVWPLRQEHGQSGNALHRPPRVWTFDFEHECVAAIKLSEQYFQDTIG